jgi:hypothetical protein
MLVYYSLQDSKGRPFPDNSTKQTWMNDFHTTVTIGEIKDKLALWHSLDPLSLRMLDSFESGEIGEEGAFLLCSSSVEYPLIACVDEGKSQGTSPESPETMVEGIHVSRVLQYLVTREKKYKPKV